MSNYKPKPFRKMKENRSVWMYFIMGGLTLTLTHMIDGWLISRDINTIIAPYTSKRMSRELWAKNTNEILNEELARREIDFVLPPKTGFEFGKVFTAINLICADYNKKGC